MNDAPDDLTLYEDEREDAAREREMERSDVAVAERDTEQGAPQACRTTFTGAI